MRWPLVLLLAALGLWGLWRVVDRSSDGSPHSLPVGTQGDADLDRPPALTGHYQAPDALEQSSAPQAPTAPAEAPDTALVPTIAAGLEGDLADARVLRCPCRLPADWPSRPGLGEPLAGYAWPASGEHLVFTSTHAVWVAQPVAGRVDRLEPLAYVRGVWDPLGDRDVSPPDVLHVEASGAVLESRFDNPSVPVPAGSVRATALASGVKLDSVGARLAPGEQRELPFGHSPMTTVTVVARTLAPTGADARCGGSVEWGSTHARFQLGRSDETTFQGEVRVPRERAASLYLDMQDGMRGGSASLPIGPLPPSRIEAHLHETFGVPVVCEGGRLDAVVNFVAFAQDAPDEHIDLEFGRVAWGQPATLWLKAGTWSISADVAEGIGVVDVTSTVTVPAAEGDAVIRVRSIADRPAAGTRVRLTHVEGDWVWIWRMASPELVGAGRAEQPFVLPFMRDQEVAPGQFLHIGVRTFALEGHSRLGHVLVRWRLPARGPDELTLDARRATLTADPAVVASASPGDLEHLASGEFLGIPVEVFVSVRSPWRDVPVFLDARHLVRAARDDGLRLESRTEGDTTIHRLVTDRAARTSGEVPFQLDIPGAEGLVAWVTTEVAMARGAEPTEVICGRPTVLALGDGATLLHVGSLAGVRLGEDIPLPSLASRPEQASLVARLSLLFDAADGTTLRDVVGGTLESGASAVPLLLSRVSRGWHEPLQPSAGAVELLGAGGLRSLWDAARVPVLVVEGAETGSCEWVLPPR